MKNITCQLLIVLALICSFSQQTRSQSTTGSIAGTVTDATGASISGATVTVINPATNITQTAQTSDDGSFSVAQLPPGTYTVTAEQQGFKRAEKTEVVLTAASRINVGDFVLEAGNIGETVTVTADAAQLQLKTESGERSDLIDNKQIRDLALNGRNLFDLFKTVPGIAVTNSNNQVSGTTNLDSFSVNGTRRNQHNIQIDGSNNQDNGDNGGVHTTINPDAVQEVKLVTSNYQAEYGKAAGGIIQYVTKSGTNEFHGRASYFRRHDSLNANNYFNNARGQARPLYRYNYYGYDIGGPIYLPRFGDAGGPAFYNPKNLFFFFSQEYYQQVVPNAARNIRVPTALERNGDFSQTRDVNGALVLLRDPTRTGTCTASNTVANPGACFVGVAQNGVTSLNVIPQNRFYSNGQAILNLMPLPNVNAPGLNYNYTSQASDTYPRREDILRIDYNYSDTTRISGRVINNADERTIPLVSFGGTSTAVLGRNFPIAGGATYTRPGTNGALTIFHAFSPTLTNEFIFGPSRNKVLIDTNGDLSATRAGNGITTPLLFPNINPSDYLPSFTFGNVTPNLAASGVLNFDTLPFSADGYSLNFIDNVTKIFDRHTIKTGIFIERNIKDQNSTARNNSSINFATGGAFTNFGSSLDTGVGYANALLGNFQNYTQSNATPLGKLRYTNIEGYVQDTWKATPRLTFDYGLRLTYYQPQYDANLNFSTFNPELFDRSRAPRLFRPVLVGTAQRAIDPAQIGTPTLGNTQPSGFIGRIVSNTGDPLNGFGLASQGYPKGGFDSRGVMFEPRFGFAYQLTGDGKTVLRGGAGVSHDRIQANRVRELLSNPPNISNPSLFNGNLNDVGTSATAPFGVSNVFGFSKEGHVPTVYSYSLSVQRDIGFNTVVDLAYVGTQSRHLLQQRNLNAIPYGALFLRENQNPAAFAGGVVPTVEPNLPLAYREAGLNFSGQFALPQDLLRPFPGYGSITYGEFVGSSNYNSMQLSVNRRFSNNFTFGIAYTWSKVFDTANNDNEFTNSFNTRAADYKLADFDRTHVFVANYVVEIPRISRIFGDAGNNGILRAIFDNYQISGVTQFSSGSPQELGININGVNAAQRIAGTYSETVRFNILSDVTNGPNGLLLNPAAFALPAIGSQGLGARTYFRGPGINNTDLALFKNFPLGNRESTYLQLRLEAFNVFNHTQFASINTGTNITSTNAAGAQVTGNAIFGTATDNAYRRAVITNNLRPEGSTRPLGDFFGEYNSARDPRILQLAVKLYF